MADNSTIVPNPLSDFASSNYALTLYVINKTMYTELASSYRSISINTLPRNLRDKIIIAESGVTSIQITNLSIDTVPLTTQGSIATSVRMDITQTRGSNLIDKIYAISQYCGWKNPFEMNYLLEIRFLGLDDENKNAANIRTMTLPLIFTAVNTNISYSSTVYNIEAVYAHAVTNDHAYSRIPENMTISTGNSLKTFFDNLAEQLNKKEREKVDYTNFEHEAFKHSFSIPDGTNNEYGIDFSQYSVGEPTSNNSTRHNQSLYQYSASQNEVVATTNSTIQAFIDNVLRYVSDIQQDLVDSEHFSLTYIIDPWLTVSSFDRLSGKETYEIKWHILPVYRRKYVKNATPESTLQENAISMLRTVKLYDYWYTGLNSEVRDIQFKLNTLYHAKIVQYQSDFTQLSSAGQYPQIMQSGNAILNANIQASISGQPDLNLGDLSDIERVDEQGAVYSYAEDIKIRDGEFLFYEPKMSSNPSMLQHAAYNPEFNRALQYKEDLDFIRNATQYSFMECDMKIKGDPYWLFPPTSAFGYLGGSNGLDEFNTRDPFRENTVLIRFNHPTNDYYESENNSVEQDLNMFSAFYYIKSVTSTFQNGKFEQQLKGIRETKISLERIKQYLREHDIL